MQQPEYNAMGRIMELIDESPRLHRLAWAVVLVGLLFALGYLSGNLPWDKFLN